MTEHKIVEIIYKPKSWCWIWNGTISRKYGTLWFKGKEYRAHRIFYEKFIGPVPKGLYVCHKCDRPSCVNPDHLFLGTQDDNMKDMVSKSRSDKTKKRGKNNGRAKLTEEDVFAIRESKARHVELAKIYKVDPVTIMNIRKRKIWGWL